MTILLKLRGQQILAYISHFWNRISSRANMALPAPVEIQLAQLGENVLFSVDKEWVHNINNQVASYFL